MNGNPILLGEFRFGTRQQQKQSTAQEPVKTMTEVEQFNLMLRNNELATREQHLQHRLEVTRSGLEGVIGMIAGYQKVRYTGWQVLLKRDGDGWKLVAIVHPDRQTEIPEEFDLAIPIPELDSVPEFQGW